jgi:uncharacterized protein
MIEITSSNSFLNLKNELSELKINSSFLSYDFHSALETSGCVGKSSGWIPFPIVARSEGKVVGFMPIYLKEHSYGEYVFDWSWAEAFHKSGLNYYPKMISAIPFSPITGRRIIADNIDIKKMMVKALEKILLDHKISSCHILFPNEEDASLFKDMGWLQREGVQFRWENKDYDNFEQFLSNLSHNKRKKIKQERKKINNLNIEVTIKQGNLILDEDIEFFYSCYCNTYLLHNSSPYLTKEFFYQLNNNIPNKLVFIFAQQEGKRVASALNIISEHSLYGRYWGALEYIPGLHFEICYYAGQEFCIQNKLKYFEGGAQGEHKLARGFDPFKTFSNHFIANSEFKSAIESFLSKEKTHMTMYADELEERSAFKKK